MSTTNVYTTAANQLIGVAEKQFGKPFPSIPKDALHSYLLNNNYKPGVIDIIDSYRNSLIARGHSNGRHAAWLLNCQDSHRYDELYNAASRVYISRKPM